MPLIENGLLIWGNVVIFSIMRVGEAARLEKGCPSYENFLLGIFKLVYTFPFLLGGMFLQLGITASIVNQYYI